MKYLGNTKEFDDLDTFKCGELHSVRLEAKVVGARCPVTGSPDWYKVEIYYDPSGLCLETKSLKLYLQTFRDVGIFCEDLCVRILEDIDEALQPRWISVEVKQQSRGGITTTATAERWNK